MGKLAIKYDGCQDVSDDYKQISNSMYNDFIYDLEDIINALEGLTYKPSTSLLHGVKKQGSEIQGKLLDFANGLDSYAEKIYTFDNGFYNNFELLDGTNSDNYKNNISIHTISDYDIIKSLIENGDPVQSIVYVIMNDALARDNSLIKELLSDYFKKYAYSDEQHKAISMILKGVSFNMKSNEQYKLIKLISKKLNSGDVAQCAKYMHDELGILNDVDLDLILNGAKPGYFERTKFLNKLVERVANGEDLRILKKSNSELTKYGKFLAKGGYKDLSDYIKGASRSKIGNMIHNWLTAGAEDFYKDFTDTFDNIKNLGKAAESDAKAAAKVSKSLGAFGAALGVVDKIMTVGENAQDDLKDANGNWQFNGENVKNFTIDTTVDLTTSAGAAAAGAAIGSVVPVVGTVVGAAAGAGINVLINHKFGDPPESAVDKLKNKIKSIF